MVAHRIIQVHWENYINIKTQGGHNSGNLLFFRGVSMRTSLKATMPCPTNQLLFKPIAICFQYHSMHRIPPHSCQKYRMAVRASVPSQPRIVHWSVGTLCYLFPIIKQVSWWFPGWPRGGGTRQPANGSFQGTLHGAHPPQTPFH